VGKTFKDISSLKYQFVLLCLTAIKEGYLTLQKKNTQSEEFCWFRFVADRNYWFQNFKNVIWLRNHIVVSYIVTLVCKGFLWPRN